MQMVPVGFIAVLRLIVMKNARLINFFVFIFVLAPFLSMSLGTCSMCHAGNMATAMEMSSCHRASTPAEASAQSQLISNCCCAGLSCTNLDTPVRSALPVKGLKAPALGLMVQMVFKGVSTELVYPLRPICSPIPRTTVVPLYQLNNSFLI